MDPFANIRNKGGNMNTRKYLLSSALIIFVILAMAAPVTAIMGSYTVAVSSYESGSLSSLSASKLAIIKDYTGTKNSVSTSTSTVDSGKSSAFNSMISSGSPSQGTVSAFSKYKGYQELEDGSSSFMEFSQSVTVTGEIFTFEFSSIFS